MKTSILAITALLAALPAYAKDYRTYPGEGHYPNAPAPVFFAYDQICSSPDGFYKLTLSNFHETDPGDGGYLAPQKLGAQLVYEAGGEIDAPVEIEITKERISTRCDWGMGASFLIPEKFGTKVHFKDIYRSSCGPANDSIVLTLHSFGGRAPTAYVPLTCQPL